MFKNLRKSIEEKEGDELPKLIAASSNSNLSERRSSTNSLVSGPPSHHTSVSSLAEPLQPVLENDTGVVNNHEVVAKQLRIEELQRHIRKLEVSLERQQDTSLRRLEQKETEWKKEFLQLEGEWQEKVNRIEREKDVVEEEKLEVIRQKLTLEDSLKSSESYREHLVRVHEEMEQQEGLQVQEMAKVKHLLLNSQEDIKERDKTIAEKDENISELQKRIDTLQADVDRLRDMENGMNNLQDEHDSLKHSFELQRQRSQSTSEEKDAEIEHLHDLINTLKRQQNEQRTLEGDERVTALVAERTALEQKLDESRQHLNEIKTTWSERISSLENQISHLNEKMAEDSSELRRVETDSQSLKQDLELKVSEMNRLKHEHESVVEELVREKEEVGKEVVRVTGDVADVQRMLEEKTAEFQKCENQLKSNTELFRNKLDALKKELAEAKDEMHTMEVKLHDYQESEKKLKLSDDQKSTELTSLHQKVNDLEACLSEKTAKCSELEILVSELTVTNQTNTSKITRLQTDLKNLKLNSDSDKQLIQDSLTNAKSELANERDRFTKQRNNLTEENSALQTDKDNLMVRNSELSQELDMFRKSVHEFESDLSDSGAKVSELEGELGVAREQLRGFEEKKENEESEVVKQLRSEVSSLEDQVVEKNKTNRLLQQRISDMKKTIQKDFKSVQKDDMNNSSQPQGFNNLFHMDHHNMAQAYEGGNNDRPPHVNREYLKHVVMKFLTSRETEALSLTKAVSTLLECTPEEEQLLRETLEWKMSWFGSKPNLGQGQTAKTIPPTF